MFEVLFANWAPSCRSLVDNVSEWFSLIFVAYRCIVGFALLNVVNSVFVSQTLKIADSDEEYLIKAQYRKKLENLFQAADVTNDGFLTMDEFMRLLEDEKMHLWLSQLQLEYHAPRTACGMQSKGGGNGEAIGSFKTRKNLAPLEPTRFESGPEGPSPWSGGKSFVGKIGSETMCS
ncbi:unnamed protein product [Durusdinium trenchii]|uniref:EF-hand domain-containing protein n=1 Tax=Durusdinium trenchii TaxID=1381693 RepID=A0ABP0RTI2_9DINO